MLMSDQFYTQQVCSRCPNDLKVRIMSWFNNDTICLECATKEDEIKKKLKEQGKNPSSYEGCGHIPKV